MQYMLKVYYLMKKKIQKQILLFIIKISFKICLVQFSKAVIFNKE